MLYFFPVLVINVVLRIIIFHPSKDELSIERDTFTKAACDLRKFGLDLPRLCLPTKNRSDHWEIVAACN